MPFPNPVAAGGGALIYPAIHSPNYPAGSPSWSINADGTATFTGVTLTGGSLVVSTPGQGVFVYSGTPTTGNLIVSIASAAGTDPYGNTYPEGLNVAAGTISGANIAGSVITAGSLSAGSIGATSIVNSDFQAGTMEETVITFDAGGGALLVYSQTMTTTTFITPGAGTFNVPASVTSVTAECWGGGAGGAGGGLAGGANSGGYGGGAGAYARATVAVTPLAALPLTVGAGGAGGAVNGFGGNGSSTFFNSNACKGAGGLAATASSVGRGGTTANSIGALKFSGGDAGSATGSGATGGGGSGGTSSSGTASPNNGGSGAGAAGAAVTGGGSGGAGAAQGSNGSAGNTPGGGGGGGGGGSNGLPGSAGTGAAGARGQVRITYSTGTKLIASISAVAGTDGLGNAYPAGIAGQAVAFDPINGGAEPFHAVGTDGSTYGTGYVAGAGGSSNPGPMSFRFRTDGDVELAGSAFKSAILAVGDTVCTLPSAYWPVSVKTIPAWSRTNATPCTLNISLTGVVTIGTVVTTGSPKTLEVDGCFYTPVI